MPVIDFSPFYGGDATARAELGAKMLAAFKDIGFVTLVNHDLPTELNSRTFAESAKFFTSLTPEQKARKRKAELKNGCARPQRPSGLAS